MEPRLAGLQQASTAQLVGLGLAFGEPLRSSAPCAAALRCAAAPKRRPPEPRVAHAQGRCMW
jgi:hypothetical protein